MKTAERVREYQKIINKRRPLTVFVMNKYLKIFAILLLALAVLALVAFSVPQISRAFDILDIMQGGFIKFTPTPGGGLNVQEFDAPEFGGDSIGSMALNAITVTSGAVNNNIGDVMDDITSDFAAIFGSGSSLAVAAVSELASGTDNLQSLGDILANPDASLTSQNILVNPYEVIEPLSLIDATFGPPVYDELAELLTVNGDAEALITISGGDFGDAAMQTLSDLQTVQNIISESSSVNRDLIRDAVDRLGPYVKQNVNTSKYVIAVSADRFDVYHERLSQESLKERRFKTLDILRNRGWSITPEILAAVMSATPSKLLNGIFYGDTLLTMICVCGQRGKYFVGMGTLETALHEILHHAVMLKFGSPSGDATIKRIFGQASAFYSKTFFTNDNSAANVAELIAEFGSALAINPNWRPPLLVNPDAVRLFNEFKSWLNQNGLVNIP